MPIRLVTEEHGMPLPPQVHRVPRVCTGPALLLVPAPQDEVLGIADAVSGGS